LFILIIYLCLIAFLTIFQKKDLQSPVFRSGKKVAWWISGLSLYMHYLAVDQGQLITGVIAEHGMAGMWFFWAGWIGIFVIPIVFAPLWRKMDFITDNQFLLFRFPGKSGQFLHQFRAIYVGGLVVALVLCFHVIGFARILEIYFDISYQNALVFTGIILCLYALKNVFDLKLKMDVLHAVLFFVSLIVIVFSLWNIEGTTDAFFNFFKANPEKKTIIPSSGNAWFSTLIFIGIQWWSCNLFDGGGPEMARFTAVKNGKSAVLTGLVPIAISLIASFIMVGHILLILGLKSNQVNPEVHYVDSIFQVIPEVMKPIVLLGFFGMFISTAESMMNWGASFLTIDVVKGNLLPKITEKQLRNTSFITMFLLSFLSVIFAFYVDNLQSLIKLTFSISAGVAPVYILRWIWFRINAWSQLSAMLSSAVFTLIYPTIHDLVPLKDYPMAESRVLVVTLLTTFVWVLVTFLTTNQSAEVRLKMLPILGSRISFLKRFALAISLGIIFLGIVVVSWKIILNS
jgi:Na+/proline symporter